MLDGTVTRDLGTWILEVTKEIIDELPSDLKVVDSDGVSHSNPDIIEDIRSFQLCVYSIFSALCRCPITHSIMDWKFPDAIPGRFSMKLCDLLTNPELKSPSAPPSKQVHER